LTCVWVICLEQIVVQGLPWSYTDDDLRPMFEQFGDLEEAVIVYGRDGRSRGYGTCRFSTADAAQEAITNYANYELEGRRLTVKLDKFA
jgi:RNA recognition motif-containing protein